jgi:hypothetical protein
MRYYYYYSLVQSYLLHVQFSLLLLGSGCAPREFMHWKNHLLPCDPTGDILHPSSFDGLSSGCFLGHMLGGDCS